MMGPNSNSYSIKTEGTYPLYLYSWYDEKGCYYDSDAGPKGLIEVIFYRLDSESYCHKKLN